VALGLAVYVVFCAWERWREAQSVQAATLPVVRAGVMMTVGLALAAVQVLPLVELILHSTRQVIDYGSAARFSWPPGHLLTLLVPNFFGEPMHTGYWGDGIYDEFIFYVGILPLLLALLALKLRHRLKPFLITLGLGGLLLAFGEYGALHRLFYRFVPLFQSARAPARAGFFFTVAAAALAGLMVTALRSDREERERLLVPLNRSLVLTVTAIGAALVVAGFAAFAWGRESNPAAGRLYHLANQVAVFVVFFLLSAALLKAWRAAAHTRVLLVALTLGLVVLDLWTFGGGAVQPVDVQGSDYWRVVSQVVDDPQAARVLPWGLNVIWHNGGMPFGLRNAFGYDPLELERYQAFTTSVPDPRARTYDLLNVGYLVTSAPQEFAEGPGTPRLLVEDSGVWVYERPDALPPVWVVAQVEVMDDVAALARIHEPDFDPRAEALLDSPLACQGDGSGEAEIVRYEENRVEARVQGGGGLLIFSEVDYPGWRASVDGKPAQLVCADYVLRAVCVPEGNHQVALTYDPPLFKIGLVATGVMLLLILGIAIWPLLRRR
jgi:hypothetical protein